MMNMSDGSMNMNASMGMGNSPMASMGQGGQMQGMQGMADPNTMGGMANHGFFGSQPTTNGLGNLDVTSILSGILNFAVELFAILLIVGFIVALFVFIKRYLFDGNLNINSSKVVCTKCGNTLHSDWNCCPKCGAAKYNPQIKQPNSL